MNGHTEPPDQSERLARMERFRAIYPKGIYRQSEWALVEREINRVEDEGDTFDTIHAGGQRYQAQCDAKGSTGTQYVMSPVKFVREHHYLEPFPLPAAQERKHPEDTGWRPTE